jgi:hypothetical protein
MLDEKRCRRCGIVKSAEEFSHSESSSDGLNSYCKECRAALTRQHYTDHIEVYRERARTAGPARRQKYRSSRQEWYNRHRVERNAWRRVYWAANRQKLMEATADWARRHPEEISEKNRRRYARSRGVTPELTVGEWSALLAAYGLRCAYCRKALGSRVTLDHMIPLSRGGTHSLDNIVPACLTCNSSKGRLTALEWFLRG